MKIFINSTLFALAIVAGIAIWKDYHRPVPVVAVAAPAVPVEVPMASTLLRPHVEAVLTPLDPEHGTLDPKPLQVLRDSFSAANAAGSKEAMILCDLLMRAVAERTEHVRVVENSAASTRAFYNRLHKSVAHQNFFAGPQMERWQRRIPAWTATLRVALARVQDAEEKRPGAPRSPSRQQLPSFAMMTEPEEPTTSETTSIQPNPETDRSVTRGPGHAIIYNPATGQVVH